MPKTFPGGIHVPGNKNTKNIPIRDFPAPPQVAIPLQQHIGAPAKPLVNVGDEVKLGQVIADFNGKKFEHTLGELLEGSRSHFMIGWLSEAILFNRAMPESCFTVEHYMEDKEPQRDTDYYYVRVRQRDGQWAWSSPIWAERV